VRGHPQTGVPCVVCCANVSLKIRPRVPVASRPTFKSFDAHCCHMGTAIKHNVPNRVKPSFGIFNIWALWRSRVNSQVFRGHYVTWASNGQGGVLYSTHQRSNASTDSLFWSWRLTLVPSSWPSLSLVTRLASPWLVSSSERRSLCASEPRPSSLVGRASYPAASPAPLPRQLHPTFNTAYGVQL